MDSKPIKLLLVAGARPNFMKIAPLIHALDRHNASACNGVTRFDWRLVHTGQHYDAKMSAVFFQDLGIPAPHFSLDAGPGSHAVQTARVMERFEPVLLNGFAANVRPDWVVVVGDVNSTVACALVAAKLDVKVVHVEAGLRSFDRTMPEEINRVVTDAISDLLLTPSEDANENLRREGVAEHRMKLVGNVMIDSLVANLAKARHSEILEQLNLVHRDFAYVTLHRPANVDDRTRLQSITEELVKLAARLPVVLPLHPRTRKMMRDFGLSCSGAPNVREIEPLGYLDSLCLAENARVVLTDSGGLQEETTYFHTPCLTLRANTERPVTVRLGTNKLTDVPHLSDDLAHCLNGWHTGHIPPLWDGHTSERILRELLTAA